MEIPGGFFDESRHLYRNTKGAIVPSSTQVYSILGMVDFSMISPKVMEWKQAFGIAFHRSVELLVKDELDWDTVDDALIPIVTGVEMRLKSMSFELISCESRGVYNISGMEFGATSDLTGTIMHHGSRRNAVIDLKSGVKFSKTWEWQLGSYIAAQPKVPLGWLGIILQSDMTGKIIPHHLKDVEAAKREFQILLAAANLSLNAGLAKLKGGD